MTIPTPAQFRDLSQRIDNMRALMALPGSTLATESAIRRFFVKKAPDAIGMAVTTGGGILLNAAVGATVGQVLGPWVAVVKTAYAADGIFGLYDLKDSTAYQCKCGQCKKNIQAIIDKKEWKAAHTAIGAATLGAWALLKMAHSGLKGIAVKLGQERPKETTSRSLHKSAQQGCIKAMAAIFHLVGDAKGLRGGDEGVMMRAVSITVADDGWSELKSNW